MPSLIKVVISSGYLSPTLASFNSSSVMSGGGCSTRITLVARIDDIYPVIFSNRYFALSACIILKYLPGVMLVVTNTLRVSMCSFISGLVEISSCARPDDRPLSFFGHLVP